MAARPEPRKTRAPRKRSPARAPARKPARAPAASKRKAPARSTVGRERRFRLGRFVRRVAAWALFLGAVALTLDALWLHERVVARMEGRVHDEPARITGSEARLAPGEVATPEGWRATWGLLGYHEVDRVRAEGQFSILRAGWTVHPRGGELLKVSVAGRRVTKLERPDGTRVAAWNFELPAVARLTDESRERRSVVPLHDIPASVQRAVVAIEDERFFKHAGVDPRGVARALVSNVRAGGVAQGGSTITQQLAKNMFLTADRTLARKGQEALIALILEQRYDKDRILEAYLNEIYLGQRSGFAILGVGEAARAWFGKDLASLRLDEAALLAGAVHSPNRTAPWKHAEEARRRRDLVLDKLEELQAFPSAEIDAARVRPVVAAESTVVRRRAAWFVDRIVSDLGDRYAPEALHRDGLELVTTLDPRLQAAAETAISEGLAALREEHSSLAADVEVALVAMDPHSGAIRALVGGSDYGRSQFDRALQARRQPGSAFKPVVLAAAISDRWPNLGPLTLVSDRPLTVPGAGPGHTDWQPRNYDGRFLGPITLRRATEQSRNLPFVRLGQKIGPERIRETAAALGVTSALRPLPSLAIGAQEVSPVEMAVVASTLAAGGVRPTPRFLEGVRDRDGEWLERGMPQRRTVLDPKVAAVVNDLLQGVVERGTARGLRRAGFTLPVAAKTGTTNKARDAWMVGYTPDLAVVLWVGYDDERNLGLSSTKAAVPLWSRFAVAIEPWLSGDSFARAPRIGPAEPVTVPDPEALGDEDRQRRRAEAAAMRGM